MADKLTKKGQETQYRTFPSVRKERNEYHLFLGFDTQVAAEEWITWGLRDRFLIEALKPGEPGRPAKAPPPRPAD